MHSTRVATFLIGAWLATCLFLDWGAFQTLGLVDTVLRTPMAGASVVPGAAEAIRGAGVEQARLLMHHFAAEQNRYIFESWEFVQIVLGLVAAGVVYLATEKRPLPMIFSGLMLTLVLVQFFAVSPELSYRGRQTDFPHSVDDLQTGVHGIAPNDNGVGTLTALFTVTEAAKLITGAILASYLFYYRSRKRKRKDEDIAEIAKAATLRAGQGPF